MTKALNLNGAFVVKEKVTHAGLFGSLEGVCETLLGLDKNNQLNWRMVPLIRELNQFERGRRFVRGFDRVLNMTETLAGMGASDECFGHMGFTGTSVWIDPKKKLGHVILSNATKNYWYSKDGINSIRRKIGSFVWKNF